jgi:hypothetical protein
MKMNNDPNWMREKAAQEDGCYVSVGSDLPPLCPDSPDGNHHVAPIGSDEEWMPSKAPCYYCGDKQAS